MLLEFQEEDAKALVAYLNVLQKGALRNVITTFVRVSPNLKDSFWSYLEQYDLPVIVGPNVRSSMQSTTAQPLDVILSQDHNQIVALLKINAACLELRSDECQIIENSSDDPDVLILQLLIDNINQPAPNITYLLLKFDLDSPVERTLFTNMKRLSAKRRDHYHVYLL
ncbi:hypothetical protein F0562_008092 [Nyssa sinensis]|uniref:Uncharacterized protein n=1 Tax=Nyssa sinensis TaxID=561372 RepID=A0A5J5A7D6_9ASTE|nr:hypothetical protein F0562_008092 [Nyssa sinensis]